MLDSIYDDIESASDHWIREMPQEIAKLLAIIHQDLYSGPVYLDSDGESVSCFDECAKRFDFSAACGTLASYLDPISDLTVSDYHCCPDCEGSGFYDDDRQETCDSCNGDGTILCEETVSGSRELILRKIVGTRVLPYL